MHARRVIAAAAALVLLAVAPAARAAIINAEDVLPAGQSGFVSLLGVTSGEGSPHLYDQLPLFTSFRYKPYTFGQPGDTEVPRDGISIVRDAYGVPAITAGGENDAWWGVGWAGAEDRLFQLELFRRATTGRLAEILGKGYLDDDLIARRDYYTRPELEKMFAAMPASLQARAAAYRDGVNAYIAYLRTHPTEIPGEFTALNVAADGLHDGRAGGDRRVPRPHGAQRRRQRADQPAHAARERQGRARRARADPPEARDLHDPAARGRASARSPAARASRSAAATSVR